jgi:hypothetical protein
MRLDLKNKILFLCNPKTASTSVRYLFDKTFPTSYENNKYLQQLNKDNKIICSIDYNDCHLNAIGMEEILKNHYNQNITDFFVFAFIRNPWDRVVSSYKYRKSDINGIPWFEENYDKLTACKLSFRDFLLMINTTDNYWLGIGSPCAFDFFYDKQNKNNLVNQIYTIENFKLEKLEKDISIHLNKQYNFNNNELQFKFAEKLPTINVSDKTTDYRDYYTEEWMITLIQVIYRHDIEIGNYKFSEDDYHPKMVFESFVYTSPDIVINQSNDNTEISSINTEEISSTNTEEISLTSTEEISLTNTEETSSINIVINQSNDNTEISSINTEEISSTNTEEISLTNTEETSSINIVINQSNDNTEISSTNTEEISLTNTEEISLTNTEEISLTNTEETSSINIVINQSNDNTEISSINTEETSSINTEETSSINTEEISSTNTEEISSTNIEEMSTI